MATNNVPNLVERSWSFQSAAYVPTGVSDMEDFLTPTAVDLSLDLGAEDGLADGEARNSDQVDIGGAGGLLPVTLTFSASMEYFAAISAGGSVEFYWSGSNHSGVGTGNPGKPDGVDGLYAGDGGGTVPESVQQMEFIGSFITTDLQVVQTAIIGTISPKHRYGQLIIVNNSGTTICGTDDIESSILAVGVMPDIAAAA